MHDLHTKIAAIRKRKVLKQLQVAQLSNIPYRTYQRIESGTTDISVEYLERIAEALDCTLEEIMGFDLKNAQFPANQAELVEQIQALKQENHILKSLILQWVENKKASPPMGSANELPQHS